MPCAKGSKVSKELTGSNCEDFARSLINNLSLLGKVVLTPTGAQVKRLCALVTLLHNKGLELNTLAMKELINGSPRLNRDPVYKQMKELLQRIPIKSEQ